VVRRDLPVARIKSRMPRRVPELSPGIARRGAAGRPHVDEGAGAPFVNPRRKRGTQEISGNRAAFLLDTFLWRSKEKYLALGGETPIQSIVALATPLNVRPTKNHNLKPRHQNAINLLIRQHNRISQHTTAPTISHNHREIRFANAITVQAR